MRAPRRDVGKAPTKHTTTRLVLAAAVLAVAAITFAASAADWVSGGAAGPKRYVAGDGWSLSYPTTMHLEQSAGVLRISLSEVTVASFPLRKAVRSGPTGDGGVWLRIDPPQPPSGGFPVDGVAFRMLRREGGPGPDLELPETRFPVRLRSFRRATAWYGKGRPRPLERTVVAGGRNYVALAWIGSHAPPARRAELARIVASLAFPALRPGDTVGYGFQVLQPRDRYRVGAFLRLRIGGQPFYLVRAPGGFYGIGWTSQTLAGGYKSRCDLQLDRRRKEFFCTNMLARWDRIGRVLVRPPNAWEDDPLNVAIAKVGWDGHVLFYPAAALSPEPALAHRLWPQWHPVEPAPR